MTKLTRKTLCALALTAMASVFAGPVMAGPTIKFGHVGQPGSLMDKTVTEFAKRANEALGDKAEVKVFGSSQLGGDSEMLKKLKLGTIDLSLPSTIMSSVAPPFALFEMPFLIDSREQMTKVRDQIVRKDMYPAAEGRGYKIIGVWENGFRNITNNKRPINKPADLDGIKLRTPKGVWRVKMFKSYGANPTPLAYSEVFVALQTGVVDGQENPLAQIYPARLYEVQDYLSMSRHVYTPAYVTAGRSWQRLPKDVQKILIDTAVEMEPVALEYGAALDDELLAKLKDAGMKVNDIDRDAFIKASEPVYKEFADEVDNGQALIDQVRSLQ